MTIDHGHLPVLKYKSIPHTFRTIVKEEGWLALYKGSLVSMLGMVPFAGTLFMTYELLEYTWGRPKQDMGPLQHFIDGSLAAACAQVPHLVSDAISRAYSQLCR